MEIPECFRCLHPCNCATQASAISIMLVTFTLAAHPRFVLTSEDGVGERRGAR